MPLLNNILKKSRAVTLIASIVFSLVSCGKNLENTKTQDLASQDGNVSWLRREFIKAAPVKETEDLNFNNYWICRQRSAIKGSSYTGRFWQYFQMRGMEVVGETSFYLDQREKILALYGVGQNGTRGSFSGVRTDRYALPYANETAFNNVRKTDSGQLIMEWTTSRCATITGVDFSVVLPELGPTCLTEPAASDSSRDAFLYALCDKEVPVKQEYNYDVSKCDGAMCPIYIVTLMNHTPTTQAQTYSANRSLMSGSIQYAYGEKLIVSEQTCTRVLSVPIEIFQPLSAASKYAADTNVNIDGLPTTRKAFLELFRTLQDKFNADNKCEIKL